MNQLSMNKRKTRLNTHKAFTHPQVRQAGLGKGVFAALFLVAAGFAYIKHTSDQQVIDYSDDPYLRTKKTISNGIETISKNNDAQNAVDELQKAGQHVKNSAQYAGQAIKETYNDPLNQAKDAYEQAKRDSADALEEAKLKYEQAKRDGTLDQAKAAFEKAKREASSVLDQARHTYEQAKHEGASVLDQAKHEGASVLDQARYKYEQAKHEGASVLDQVKHEGSSVLDQAKSKYEQVKREGKSALDHVKEETRQTLNESESVIRDKVEHFKAEHHLKQGTRTPEEILHEEEIGFWNNILRPDESKPARPIFDRPSSENGNPMVYEKLSTSPTKPEWEKNMEHYAVNTVRDTSTLVSKDTEKVRGVWEDKAARDAGHTPPRHEENPNSFWSHLFGKASEKAQQLEHKAEHAIEKEANKASALWNDLTSKADKNAENIKQQSEHVKDDLASKAANAKNEAYYKAESVKDDIAHAKNEAYYKAESVKNDLANKAESVKNDLANKAANVKNEAYYKAENIKDDLSNKAANVKDEAYYKAESIKDDVYDKANDLKNKTEDVKNNVAGTVQNLYSRASNTVADVGQTIKEETNHVANRLEETGRDAYDYTASSINGLHKEFSAGQRKVEKEAKSWFEKGTEQIKSGLGSVKEVAERDLHWAEHKVQDARHEIGRVFGRGETGVAGHVARGEKYAEEELGHLRATRENVNARPAEIIVENANGKDM